MYRPLLLILLLVFTGCFADQPHIGHQSPSPPEQKALGQIYMSKKTHTVIVTGKVGFKPFTYTNNHKTIKIELPDTPIDPDYPEVASWDAKRLMHTLNGMGWSALDIIDLIEHLEKQKVIIGKVVKE